MVVERMSDDTSIKRRRGAQPGNQNAKGNRGNLHPRPNYGNRGGKGAPIGNQYARRKLRPLGDTILPEYRNNAEARAWIEAHLELLLAIPDDCAVLTDPVEIAKFSGLTPESIAEKGRELELGLFTAFEYGDESIRADEQDEAKLVA
jgi:hypothetical protein